MIAPIDTVSTSIAVIVSLMMLAGSIVLLIYMSIRNRFRWVLLLVGLSVLQNIAATMMFISEYMQRDEEFESKNKVMVPLMNSLFTSLFYFSNNLIYWLYSFKQWAISYHLP